MQTRRSCRTFSPEPVEADKIEALKRFLAGNRQGPFGATLRFELFDFGAMSKEAIRACGTYGVIRSARRFIVGAVEKKTGALEDFGYGMERNILHAQSLGLSTCWLGGTFKRTGFSERIGLRKNEVLPAVAPVGYAANRRSIVDRVLRMSAGSDRRKPWADLFFDRELRTLSECDAGPYKLVLECLRLAPSAVNKQPWCIMKDGTRYHFYLERSLGYSGEYGEIQLQNVDMGIAMCHFEFSARELGLEGSWLSENPGLPSKTWEYIATWQGLS